jgi:hypothetical protein
VAVLTIGAATLRAEEPSPAGRFLAHARTQSSIPTDALKLMEDTWAKCEDCDGEEFLTQALALFSEPFRAGLDAYGTGDFDACRKIMSPLAKDADPFIAVHAAAYEIKALVGLERPADALARIEELLGAETAALARVEAHSYFGPEMVFLRGFCLLSDLRYDAAAEALLLLKQRYPGASQRLIVSAEQMLKEIEDHQPGRIAEVADLMGFAGQRLTQGDTGERVRTRQERIIEILDKLIKEAEDQEQSSSSSSSSGGGGGGSGRSGGGNPSSPMQDSALPGGAPGEGPLHDRPRANPGEMWGAMPPAERERVLQALRDNFPSRYRQLVEQYYEHLAKKP